MVDANVTYIYIYPTFNNNRDIRSIIFSKVRHLIGRFLALEMNVAVNQQLGFHFIFFLFIKDHILDT